MPTNPIDVAPIHNRSLIQRFCGRWLISWRLLAINIFLSMFLIVGGDLSRSDENTNIKLYVIFWLLGYFLIISFAAIIATRAIVDGYLVSNRSQHSLYGFISIWLRHLRSPNKNVAACSHDFNFRDLYQSPVH